MAETRPVADGPAPTASTIPTVPTTKSDLEDPAETHARLFVKDRFPSATACAECHPTHYQQWSVSQHAYSQLSPVFNAMQGRVLQLTNGTTGDFCIRCHTPIGMALQEPVFGSNSDRHPTSREGVTCIVCHRVNKAYGKVNARFGLESGGITAPVYGPSGNETAIRAAVEKDIAVDNPKKQGRLIHSQAKPFFQLTTAASCGMCHDVTLANGLREIEAFSAYKSSCL